MTIKMTPSKKQLEQIMKDAELRAEIQEMFRPATSVQGETENAFREIIS